MRLSVCCCSIMLITAQLLLAKTGNSQNIKDETITIEAKNEPLKKTLKKIEKLSGFQMAYPSEKIVLYQNITIPKETRTVEKTLKLILDNTDLDFKQFDKKIIIFEKSDVKNKSSDAIGPPNSRAEYTAGVLKGKVYFDDNSQPVPGASVILKNDPGVGTTTNNAGEFELNIPDKYNGKPVTVVVAYIGYNKEEVTAANLSSLLIIRLKPASSALSEVVVTALGIRKERKAVGFSVTEVKGEDLVQAREVNVANALEGKVAGVNVSSLASGPGGSSRVVIRGSGSIAGNNQPLYVVNGMPIDNVPSTPNTTNGSGTSLNVDNGDGISGINPDDIESISVLKGGTASALYGSRASNGVILITTKKGAAQKGVGVEYNSTFAAETPLVIPDWQYQYGEGKFGTVVTNQQDAISYGRLSFGAKLDGSSVIQFDGVSRPYIAQKNNIKNFYNTGKTFTNTVAFTGGSEALNFRFSVSDLNNKGIVPNNSLDKKISNLNVNAKLGKNLSIEAVAQYNVENNINRPGLGDALGNPNWGTYMIANSVDIRNLAPGYDANGNETLWNVSGYASNPYFVVNRFQEKDTKNRFIGYASVKYNLLDNLFIKGRVSDDYLSYDYTGITPTGTAYAPQGVMNVTKYSTSEINSELTLNYNTKFLKDFNVNVLAGGNKQQHTLDGVEVDGSNFNIPFFYSLSNVNAVVTLPKYTKTAVNSVFASADFDYKGIAYLSVTGRNDWFSTLSIEDDHIFYPSVSGSFILSEATRLPEWISYAKLRASWAQVGGGAPNPYGINLTYSQLAGSTIPLQQISRDVNGDLVVPNSKLKPYISQTFEVGTELKFFKNRLGLDLALYNRTTINDIVPANVDPLSGFSSAYLNIGKISNKGIELLLTGRPVKADHFTWDVTYTYSYNKNTVEKLAAGQNSFFLGTAVNSYVSIYAEVGKPYGQLQAYALKKDAQGRTVYAANGNEEQGAPVDLGTGVAPSAMSITNSFNYHRFNFSFLIDGKYGNKIYSGTNLYGDRFGLLKSTLPGRESGLALSGVDDGGQPFNYTVPVSDLANFYDNRKNISSFFVYDGSFIKLRQVIFGYNVPAKHIGSVKIQSLNVSFVARNLLILYKKAPNIDPESTFTAGNEQGLEMFGVPRTRSYGLNLMVKF
ncbi:SusC/RagA family TonB-linked outer membrane protein [Mucilaginibacter ginsenosidivorans]|uniref:SusC/RagA family TonB-linked outer membrane protein n=1 Tax=Mucilaginibacter ginsenosidivorans TaxID=398053 RepID=A0A5B8V3R5_9SPHI|nr:SusC/RagA family TonB-linked outer membrane protein [Mucilaginibacter ginsenosidivorans]QEC65216.1 SusC/RagA family TonB-linked outer membrane protein [Mucilaginibacter ginsenosidivorans]